MDGDYRELAQWLFAVAAAMLEDATEISTAGHSPRLAPTKLAQTARKLRSAANDIAVIAEAARIAADLGINHDRPRSKKHR